MESDCSLSSTQRIVFFGFMPLRMAGRTTGWGPPANLGSVFFADNQSNQSVAIVGAKPVRVKCRESQFGKKVGRVTRVNAERGLSAACKASACLESQFSAEDFHSISSDADVAGATFLANCAHVDAAG